MGKLLIENGAMTDILDNLVKTPAEVANDNEHKEMANFLKDPLFTNCSGECCKCQF